jgi:energy-coupling factor transporter ATP-binding protein EcfA2
MYIDQINLENIRTFTKGKPLEFMHPDRVYRSAKTIATDNEAPLPKPRLPNVTLLLGDNGSGKTTVLRALAAAAFGPTAKDLLRDASLVRFGESTGQIEAKLTMHDQDRAPFKILYSGLGLQRIGERLDVRVTDYSFPDLWQPVYESENQAFFVVGYGATRRVERLDRYDPGARAHSRAMRDLRVWSLFEDSFSLIPLASWLPRLRQENPGRFKQVVHLLERLLAPGHYRFSGKQEKRGDYLFSRGDMLVPFQDLSDGYKAFIGWVGDLLFHVCYGCPSGKKLVESCGLVLVDEIDLHLHPKWQMQVIRIVARALPRMQFVFTSHSPLVAGSLEWMNIIRLTVGTKTNRTIAKRLHEGIHGLDADQILLSEFFGLKSTRAATKMHQLTRLRHEATLGDDEAKRAYVRALASGMESVDNGQKDDVEEDGV